MQTIKLPENINLSLVKPEVSLGLMEKDNKELKNQFFSIINNIFQENSNRIRNNPSLKDSEYRKGQIQGIIDHYRFDEFKMIGDDVRFWYSIAAPYMDKLYCEIIGIPYIDPTKSIPPPIVAPKITKRQPAVPVRVEDLKRKSKFAQVTEADMTPEQIASINKLQPPGPSETPNLLEELKVIARKATDDIIASSKPSKGKKKKRLSVKEKKKTLKELEESAVPIEPKLTLAQVALIPDIQEIQRRPTLNIVPPIPYSPYDPYYLHDYIAQFSQGDFETYEDEFYDFKESLIALWKPQLLRIVHVINGDKPIYYIKTKPDTPFDRTNCSPWISYKTSSVKVLIKSGSEDDYEEGGEPECKFINIFEPLMNDLDFQSREVVWEPYHAHQKNPVNAPFFNIFPGFKSRVIPNFDPKVGISGDQYHMIEPILEQIGRIWCKGNIEHYRYILSWFAYTIRELKKTEIGLSINGKPGCGKTCIAQNWMKYIYGPVLGNKAAGLTKLCQQFNSIMCDKMFFIIEELGKVNKSKSYIDMFNMLKDLITGERVAMEKKGIDPVNVNNFLSMIFFSNYDNSLFLDQGDRRHSMFKCSDETVGNKEYYNRLFSCFTQEHFNILYSWMLSDQFLPYYVDIRKIPETEARLEAIEMSRPKADSFSEDLFINGTVIIDVESLNRVATVTGAMGIFITSANIYELYKNWYAITSPRFKASDRDCWLKIFKSSCPYVTYEKENRQTIDGKQVRGCFINEAVWDTCCLNVPTIKPPGINSFETKTIRQWF